MASASDRPDPILPTPRPDRPRLLAPTYEAELAKMAGVASTTNAHRHHYATVAARALFDLEQPGWAPREKVFAHFVKRNGDLKWTMLSELGRLPDEPSLVSVARIVGRQQLPTGQAVAFIRRLRIGDGTPTQASRTERNHMTQPQEIVDLIDDALAHLEHATADLAIIVQLEQPGASGAMVGADELAVVGHGGIVANRTPLPGEPGSGARKERRVKSA